MGNILSSTNIHSMEDVRNYMSSNDIQTDFKENNNEKILLALDFIRNNDTSIINEPIINDFTVLQYAIKSLNYEIIEKILEFDDIDVNVVDKEGNTLLMLLFKEMGIRWIDFYRIKKIIKYVVSRSENATIISKNLHNNTTFSILSSIPRNRKYEVSYLDDWTFKKFAALLIDKDNSTMVVANYRTNDFSYRVHKFHNAINNDVCYTEKIFESMYPLQWSIYNEEKLDLIRFLTDRTHNISDVLKNMYNIARYYHIKYIAYLENINVDDDNSLMTNNNDDTDHDDYGNISIKKSDIWNKLFNFICKTPEGPQKLAYIIKAYNKQNNNTLTENSNIKYDKYVTNLAKKFLLNV